MFICSLHGLCITVSQLIISLAIFNIYLSNPEVAKFLRSSFDCIEDNSQLMLINQQLIINSLLAEEGHEKEQAELSRDLISAINDDLKAIKTQTRNTNATLVSFIN